ncbi:MAG: type III-A CRISPR-associated RAMP protein Csm3 [Candidatus Cloacimonas sp. 4484_209]|nr:MAG: type III-A CRISPR-associated RAMP protein Csm3 [Candidatus Cloacimonas sp. 4484_209]
MNNKKLYGKIVIKGIIHTLTGLHIGGSKETLEIGTVDLPVIRDPVTREPYIPGSSIKGKMRSLLERYKAGSDTSFFSKNVGNAKIHACNTKEEAFNCEVCRVFGSTGGKDGSNFPSRIKVRDAYFTLYTKRHLENAETDFLFSEVKYENVLDRITAAANPRQIERVPRGSDFSFEIVYDVEEKTHIEEDIDNIVMLMNLIEDDYIGGHGSRGYGKVKFYITECIAKKIEAYKGESNSEKVILSSDVKLEDVEKPEEELYTKLASVSQLKEKVQEIVDFFKS